AAREGIVEEVLVDAEMKAPKVAPAAKEIVTEKDEEQMDEAIQTLSSTDRKKAALVKQALDKTSRSTANDKEIDLINNFTVPADQAQAGEVAPDIDEEIQTLN
ncbi:MAG: hypothetical protein H7177_11200, partial [Rhizobacter sp.]|nr:hypothetical protein [Bacteriovorax sp.]